MAYAVSTNAPDAGRYRLQSPRVACVFRAVTQGRVSCTFGAPLQVWCLGVTSLLPERVQGGSIINS